jgi:pyruvate,water dikinase
LRRLVSYVQYSTLLGSASAAWCRRHESAHCRLADMNHIVQLTDATDPKLVGGKAANLGRLLTAGIPVPPGFAITTEAFTANVATEPIAGLINRSFDAIEKGANVEEIELISNEIRRVMQDIGLENEVGDQLSAAYRQLRAPFVAVRSSATVEDGTTAAWAGQLESYLYIDKEISLSNAVINCWASLYSPRALSYRLAQGSLRKPVAVATIVQLMVVAEKSGVAFTVDPITNDSDTLVVEAVWGDCEQLVSGEITPDSYHFNKKTDLLTHSEIATQDTCRSRGQQFTLLANRAHGRKITDGELLQLARLCDRVQDHFGRPQDIEWVYDGKTFYIVQARPITTFTLPTT